MPWRFFRKEAERFRTVVQEFLDWRVPRAQYFRMSNWAAIIAEDKIVRAIEEGKFENLEGAGLPLPPDEAANLPPEMRMAYRILKSAGYISNPSITEQEVVRVVDLLEEVEDERDRYRQMQKLEVLVERIRKERRKGVRLDKDDEYYSRILERVRLSVKGTSF